MHYPHKKSGQQPLHKFHGGLHLPDNKKQSNGQPVLPAPLPNQLILPLQQHIGEIAQPLVKVGNRVLKGEMIARAQGRVSASLHAPTSGQITAIKPMAIPHPSGLTSPCIVIDSDGEERWAGLPPPIEDYLHADPETLRARIGESGIVGLGGALFPTQVKLTPGAKNSIHTLIINGAECEPFITCDDMLMREQADQIVKGIAIIKHLLGAANCLIGIEDNKPEAIDAMSRAVDEQKIEGAEVVTIPTHYPSGGEKQLIRVLTGLEVPSGKIPASIGFVCHNVGTAAAVSNAITLGQPLISRYVTITGEGIRSPCNLHALIGTPISQLMEQAGGYTDQANRLIMGGPMMGITLPGDDLPITKGTNCLLAASTAEAPDPGPALPCIRCGRCAEACPASLLPQQLYWHTRAKDLEKVQDYNLFDCIECGCCAHVCPSHIPLVQYYRYAKTESWTLEQERNQSETARQRHEAKATRLARIDAERKARLRKKKEGLNKKPVAKNAAEDPKKAAIEAALKRTAEKKAKQAESGVTAKNTDDLTASQQQAIEAVDKLRTEAATEAEQDN
ncbi:MAG: electron transport complex subunit RsxC [Gammaproteobacteria bacterium]|nr:electron transport complex subunit RsxC [Gammaproteobacteria bacterium]